MSNESEILFETDSHSFILDGNSRIISKEKKTPAGMLESQSVTTLLLVEIASELRRIRLLLERP